MRIQYSTFDELEAAFDTFQHESMPVMNGRGESLLIFMTEDGRLASQRVPTEGDPGTTLVASWAHDIHLWPVEMLTPSGGVDVHDRLRSVACSPPFADVERFRGVMPGHSSETLGVWQDRKPSSSEGSD